MKHTIILCWLFFVTLSYGQSIETNINGEQYKSAPDCAKLMYSENPNVDEVESIVCRLLSKSKKNE